MSPPGGDPCPRDAPFARFRETYARAVATGMRDPNAMCLATVDAVGRPTTRMVLLKSWDERGFVFYTNVGSRKALDMVRNPAVSLTFYWPAIEQQIHIRGTAAPVSDAEADAYFVQRPRISQLGAWASRQSVPLAARAVLVAETLKLGAQFLGRSVPRPAFWSGFRVAPVAIEFWTAGRFRLHDRLLYERSGEDWGVMRLYP